MVLPGGVLAAIGLGLSLVPATIAAVQGVPAAESGLASGRAQHVAPGRRGARPGRAHDARRLAHRRQVAAASATLQAQTDGYGLAFAVGAVSVPLGAIAAATLMGRRAEAPAGRVAEEQAA